MPPASKQNIEDDLTGDGTHVLPTLIARLLVIMTHDKKITYGPCSSSSAALRTRFIDIVTLRACTRLSP